jgi:hypothetical protein
VFRALVLARIIEPTSKLDALRVLAEAGVESVSYRTLTRRLPRYGKPLWRKDISAACAAHAALGPASLVLYDVSTLYFETDAGDGFRCSDSAPAAVAAGSDSRWLGAYVCDLTEPIALSQGRRLAQHERAGRRRGVDP